MFQVFFFYVAQFFTSFYWDLAEVESVFSVKRFLMFSDKWFFYQTL